MARFFIDTSSGTVATQRQLLEAGIATEADDPPRPWLEIRGNRDANTMWHTVLRKRERGIFIGAVVFRHSDHHASLLTSGWEEIPLEELRAPALG
jgi:hypothetical protein